MRSFAPRRLQGPECACAPSRRVAHKNPGIDLLAPDDWISLAERLQLTARELSVAILIFEGNSRFQISRRLGCAPGTVRVYIDRLFAKLQVTDRVGVVLRVVRIHWALVQAQTNVSSHKDATCEAGTRD